MKIFLTALMVFSVLFVTACEKKGADYKRPLEKGFETPVDPLENPTEEVASLMEKVGQIDDIVHSLEPDSMETVQTIFTDLTPAGDIPPDDEWNLSGSDEAWLYSAQDDLTVVVHKALNAPIYLFLGKEMTDADRNNTRTILQEIFADKEPTPPAEEASFNLQDL